MATSSASSSTSVLTLKYSGAAVSALVATFSTLALLSELFGLWTGTSGSLMLLGGYQSIMMTAVVAALFSVLAFCLYRNVTKEVAKQPGYVNKTAYHFITNAFLAVLAGVFVLIVAGLVSILLSSLVLIGTSTDIGGMYLNDFLPGLVAAGLVGFVGFAAYKIMIGKNLSMLMTVVLMSLAGALMIAALITIPIKAHMSSSSSSSNSTNMYDSSDYNNYLNDYFNEYYKN